MTSKQLPKGNGTQAGHKYVTKPYLTREGDQRLKFPGRRTS
jgi:hypothetical protein